MGENTNWNYLRLEGFGKYKAALEQHAQDKETVKTGREILQLRANQYFSEIKKLDKRHESVKAIWELLEELIELLENNSDTLGRVTEIVTEISNHRGEYGKRLPRRKSLFSLLFGKKPLPEGTH